MRSIFLVGLFSLFFAWNTFAQVVVTVTSSTDDGTGAPNTLSAAINACNGSASGGAIYFSGISTVSVSGVLPQIQKDITIDGQGCPVVIQAVNPGFGAFSVLSGIFQLKDVTIQNFRNPLAGGAVYSFVGASIDILENVTFSNNQSEVSGGAIFANDQLTVAPGGVFIGNKSGALTGTSNKIGGAICSAYNGILDLSGASFVGNVADYGGAVATINIGATLMLQDCIFNSDTAVVAGGAVYALSGLNIQGGCSFVANYSGQVGGAIFYDNSVALTLAANIFSSNSAQHGGAIFTTAQTPLSITSGTFNNNYARASGGFLYCLGTLNVASSNKFTYNEADSLGGAIYYQNAANLTLGSACEFNHNSTTKISTSGVNCGGGALYVTLGSGSVDVSGCTFYKNSSAQNGGAIVSYSSLGISSATFKENRAGEWGGAVLYEGASDIDLTASSFISNTAGIFGGGLMSYNPNAMVYSSAGTFTGNSVLDANGGPAGAGGFLYARGPVSAGQLQVTFCTAYAGAAIFAEKNVSLNSADITDCTGVAGAIQLNGDAINSISSCQILRNGLDGIYVMPGNGKTTISANVLWYNYNGVTVLPGANHVTITQNSFSFNAMEAINTGQHSALTCPGASTYGNQSIGLPVIQSLQRGSTGKLDVTGSLCGSLTNATVEFYKVGGSDGNDGGRGEGVAYLGSLSASGGVFSGTITPPSYSPFNSGDMLTAIVIDANGNTSEFSTNVFESIALHVVIDDTKFQSPMQWLNGTVRGTWDPTLYTYSNLNEDLWSYYPGVNFAQTSPHIYEATVYVFPSNDLWEFGVFTANNERYGAWSFNGVDGDTVRLEAYQVAQNYNFDNPSNPGNRYFDYKLLSIVDGTTANPIRNSRYLSINNTTNYNGGGGGTIIKYNSSVPTVTLNASTVPVGGSPGVWTTGFLVVNSDADLKITGSGTRLMMDNSSTNGNAQIYGSRLIIEKDYDQAGIFSIESGANIFYDPSYSMFFYHHVLDDSKWSWLGLTQPIVFQDGGLSNLLCYTASSPGEQFALKEGPYIGPYLYLYAYDEGLRASTPPNLEAFGGKAWVNNMTGAYVSGLIASIYSNTDNYRDLYYNVYNVGDFYNASRNLNVRYDACTIPGQLAAAEQYLGTGYTQADAQNLINSYHSGWNLIGNPYTLSLNLTPSSPPLSTQELGIAAMRNAADTGYSYWNSLGLSIVGDNLQNNVNSYYPGSMSTTFRIPPFTPFFAQAKNTDPMYIPTSFSYENSVLRSSGSGPEMIRINLVKNDNKVLGQSILAFASGATSLKDPGMDVPVLQKNPDDVFLLDDMGSAMAINVIKYTEGFETPVGLKLSAAGTYQFKVVEMNNLNDGDLVLKDKRTQTETPLRLGGVYSFAVDAQQVKVASGLFSIKGIKKATGISELTENDPFVYVEGDHIVVDNLMFGSDVLLVDMMGRVLSRTKADASRITLPVSVSGNYVVRIIHEGNVYVSKVIR